RRAREDARRVRQAPQGDGGAPARDPRRQLRRAEGRLLRLPGPIRLRRQEDARGEEDRERRPALRVADRGSQGGRRTPIGPPRPRLRPPVVRHLDEERRGGREENGRGAAEAGVGGYICGATRLRRSFSTSVVRFNPSSSAARFLLPPVRSRASPIMRSSTASSMARRSVPSFGSSGSGDPGGGVSRGVRTPGGRSANPSP